MGAMLPLKSIFVFSVWVSSQMIFCLGVGVAKTTVADVQTVPVFGPVVSIKILK